MSEGLDASRARLFRNFPGIGLTLFGQQAIGTFTFFGRARLCTFTGGAEFFELRLEAANAPLQCGRLSLVLGAGLAGARRFGAGLLERGGESFSILRERFALAGDTCDTLIGDGGTLLGARDALLDGLETRSELLTFLGGDNERQFFYRMTAWSRDSMREHPSTAYKPH